MEVPWERQYRNIVSHNPVLDRLTLSEFAGLTNEDLRKIEGDEVVISKLLRLKDRFLQHRQPVLQKRSWENFFGSSVRKVSRAVVAIAALMFVNQALQETPNKLLLTMGGACIVIVFVLATWSVEVLFVS